jgi:hypothetical protein
LGPIVDWCGIFALWAIKKGGVGGGLGVWKKGSGISSVPGMFQTSSPLKGDVAAATLYKDGKPNGAHMDLVFSVSADGRSIQTIDGNDGGKVTGPSSAKSKTSFTSGFYTAFLSPVGTWDVKIGDYNWIYTFNRDGTAKWSDIKPRPEMSGGGTWDNSGDVLKISWDPVPPKTIGSVEQWDTPLKVSGQQGNFVGQGRIITANKRR